MENENSTEKDREMAQVSNGLELAGAVLSQSFELPIIAFMLVVQGAGLVAGQLIVSK